jgi:steroid 5-alpha reductase family enzyme
MTPLPRGKVNGAGFSLQLTQGKDFMKKTDRNSLIIFPILVLIGFLVALAGSQGGALLAGIPAFGLSVGLAFLIQWLVFIPSYWFQTEKFFDLTGSLTYISITIMALLVSPVIDNRSLLLAGLVVIWAVRLGGFLFRRIQKAGKDDRFDELKPSFFRFLNVWTIQGLWVTFTVAAALVAITSSSRKELDVFAIIGLLIWAFGFAIEVIADNQKSRFSANPDNKGKFIQTGLWSRSRHPNYFGEIMLWVGIAIIALPVLQGWQWVAMISPLFVTLLLTRVSGVPLLEKKADTKWGGQEEYESYKKRTPVLIPKL